MRKLASIQKILDIAPIDGADKIEVATILGWKCVVKKGEFKTGELVVYIEYDSVLPEKPEFEFMRQRNFKVKTVKMRKQISQGLCFPTSILPQSIAIEEDVDVTEILGVKKYEPQVFESGGPNTFKRKGNFPSFLHKTDETRIQAIPKTLEKYRGQTCYITEKCDGSSFTAFLNDSQFGVCSRNMEIQEDDCNNFWRVAKSESWQDKLQCICSMVGCNNVAVQCEMIGPGIQGNKYKLSNIKTLLFNIFNIDTGRYLDFIDLKNICNILNIEMVPILNENFILNATVDDMVKLSIGESSIYKTVREGIVVRPLVEQYDDRIGRFSFKVINPEFLLKHGE